MIGAVDMHCGPQHRAPADPYGRIVENNTVSVEVDVVPKKQVPAIGNVKWSLKKHAITDAREEDSKLWCTRPAQHGIHGVMAPAGLPGLVPQFFSNSGVIQEYQCPSATPAKAWGTGFMALSGDVIEVTKGQIISYCIVTEM